MGGRWAAGGSVQRGHYPQQKKKKTCSGCVTARGSSLYSRLKGLFWFLENGRTFRFYLQLFWGGRAQRENELPPFLPAFLIPSGSVSMSGIYQDLPRWVRACPCSSQIALHNLRNVDERCLACPRWAREMDNVCYKCCTHTKHRAHTLLYLQCQMTLLSP